MSLAISQDLTSLLFSDGVLRADELPLLDGGLSLAEEPTIPPPPVRLVALETDVGPLTWPGAPILSSVPFSR